MSTKLENTNSRSSMPHRVAVVLALIVFPLIWVGGLVTTYDAGMAVPDWPGTYGYNMFLYPLETWLFGPFDLFVEHGHRLLGSLAGLVAIVLVFVTMRNETRKSVRWMSVGLLALVICQGLLGGLRVLFDARAIAKVHGCVGPAFFAAVVGFCVVTSRWWMARAVGGFEGAISPSEMPRTEPRNEQHSEHGLEQLTVSSLPNVKATGLIYWSTLMLMMSFGQLVVGAFLRHIAVDASPRVYTTLVLLHVATALLLFVGTITQWVVSRLSRFKGIGIRGSINFLMLLVVVQIMLGIGTWVVKFGWPVWFAELGFAATFVVGEKTFIQMNLITAHVAVGSLILAGWAYHMMRCRRVLNGQVATGEKETEFQLSEFASRDNGLAEQQDNNSQPTPQPLTSS